MRGAAVTDHPAESTGADLVDERLQVGQHTTFLDERDEGAHGFPERGRARAEPGAAKVAGLRGEHQLDRDDARSELDHRLEAPGRERRHRHPVLDPFGLGGRDDLERNGMGEQARLRREGLDRDPELAERALGQPRAGPEALGQARQRCLEQLDGALGSARDHRGQGEPGQVECGRERLDLEVADRDHPVFVDEDERVGLRGVELDRDLTGDEAEGVTADPLSWTRVRKLRGSCRARASTSLPSSKPRTRPSVACSPG